MPDNSPSTRHQAREASAFLAAFFSGVAPTPTPTPTATPEPVTPPSNLRYTSGSSWVNVLWDSTSGLTYKARISGGSWRSTSGSSMLFGGLFEGTTYFVWVYAQNANGDKSDTVSMSVSTGCSDPGFNCLIASEESVNSEISPSASAYAAIWSPTSLVRSE